jgi:flagellar hook-associated protein FlgK
MIKLIQYQLGYNAAAKLCATAQEMMDTLLQLKQ